MIQNRETVISNLKHTLSKPGNEKMKAQIERKLKQVENNKVIKK